MKKKNGRRTTGNVKPHLLRTKGMMERLLELKEGQNMMIYYKKGTQKREKFILCRGDTEVWR